MLAVRTALAALALTAPALSAAAVPAVVADVAAVHSIVSRIMNGVGKPVLLLPPGASPHDYSLRPSEAAALEAADLVFWVGDSYTPWLAEPIATIAAKARDVALQDAPMVRRLPVRHGGPFEAHLEHAEDEDEHLHDHGSDDEHHDAAMHSGLDGTGTDGHLWLDPLNAAAMATAAAQALAEADPDNAETYHANAVAFGRETQNLLAEVQAMLEPAHGHNFIVFHDAYQYFEKRFVIPASGSIALHDADQPSPARLAEIRERMRNEDVACVFAEPQFSTSLLDTVTDGMEAQRGTLDPIGIDLEPGSAFYPALIRNLAVDLTDCLLAD